MIRRLALEAETAVDRFVAARNTLLPLEYPSDDTESDYYDDCGSCSDDCGSGSGGNHLAAESETLIPAVATDHYFFPPFSVSSFSQTTTSLLSVHDIERSSDSADSPHRTRTLTPSTTRTFTPTPPAGTASAPASRNAPRRTHSRRSTSQFSNDSLDDHLGLAGVGGGAAASSFPPSASPSPAPAAPISAANATSTAHRKSASHSSLSLSDFSPELLHHHHRRSRSGSCGASSITTLSSKPQERKVLTPFASHLFRSSFQTLASVVTSWYFGHYDCTVMTALVMLTSILYWHNAVNGWRRHMDICTSISVSFYHQYKAFVYASRAVFSVYFVMFLLLGFFYYNARECTKVGDKRGSAYWHMLGLHSFGNVCNVVFYATC